MRVGISTSVIQGGLSGVGQYVFALLREMIPFSQEHEFTLFVLEKDLPLFEFARAHMRLVSVPEAFRPPVKNIRWHQMHLPGIVRRLRLEVLHVPSYRRLLWRKPCALVATIHDLAPFRVPGKYDWKRMLYGRVIARRLAHRQDAIVAISQNTARDIETFFRIPLTRIQVVYNGIEHDRFYPGPKEDAVKLAAGRYGLTRPFFLYVARLEHPGKNHVRLISAFEEFKAATHSDWLLALAGSNWHGAEVIEAAIRQSPFAADVRRLGFVPDAELPDLYRAADVFVYPSLYEGFGLPPLEAMACGCPVIASTRGSLGEILGDAAAAVEPEDIHPIARQLYVLATDTGVRNRLRAAGLAQARKFNWQKTATEMLSIYARVCNCTSKVSDRVSR
jgi:glycosyltransferase involved in cell wall biosynthesis